MILRLFLALIVISSFAPGQAAVNMRNGSYTETWVDYIDPKPGMDLRIERFYSSRSLFIGLFGFGWCSNLETHLTITSDGIINLTECGGGLEITYYPKDFDVRSPTETVESIVADYKKSQNLSTNDAKNLRAQLNANPKMRFEYANKLGLISIKKIKKNNNVFLSKSKGFEKITFNGRFYERKKYDGSIQRFNPKGQLIQHINPTGLWTKLNYKGSKIAYLVDDRGRRLNFQYDNNGKLVKIFNGRGLDVIYSFQGENLVSVKNMWSKTYNYSYDSSHNLVRVDFPDKTNITLTYDVARDWIKTYTNRKECREDFNFLLSKSDPQNHYWGTYTRKCKGEQETKGRHGFWYKNYSFSKDKYLHKVQEFYEKDFKEMYFHPFLGRPTSVRQNNIYKGFAYFLNGLVNKREFKRYSDKQEILDWNKMTFSYDFSEPRITESRTDFLNEKGKTIKKEKVIYTYNSKGLLVKAKNPKGPFVTLVYNDKGKIEKIRNHKKVELKLGYKIGVEKPVEIDQKGLGKITIGYDADGAIESVETSGERNLATSVVESFLEMVDFLGPLGENLKI